MRANSSHLEILRAMLSAPTATFCEQAVVAVVAEWASRRGVKMTRDGAGNVFLRYRRGRRARTGRGPRWFLTAHMDHPGFVVLRSRGRTVWAHFRGHVLKEFFAGAKVRFFPPGCEATAIVLDTAPVPSLPWLLCRLETQEVANVPAGTLGMWDLPAFRVRAGRVMARSCDDVAGSAAVVCAMDDIVSRDVDADVTGLLTRAEEGGFVGALWACKHRSIPADAKIVSVEASKAHAQAPLGGGAVVRVGDRTWTFDPTLTAHLSNVAEELAKRDKTFRFTRQLMSGGTCESMVFCIYGYTAAAACLPLGNYHNMGPDGRIAPERIDLDDFESLVNLLVAVAADPRPPEHRSKALMKHLTEVIARRGKFLFDRGGGGPVLEP